MRTVNPRGNPPAAWGIALGLVSLFGVLLVVFIRFMHMHPDEQLAYFFTRRDLSFLWWYLATQDTHPPLWFTSFWFLRHIFGDTEFVARFYSALLSLLTLALVYQLGRRWFGSPRCGWFAVAVLGVNAFFIYHALEMRPYALIMLLATLSMWTFQRWLARRTWRSAAYYAVTVALMLYIHYFLFVLILIQALYYVVLSLRARVPLRQFIGQGAGVALLAFVLWLPWFPSALNQVATLRQAELQGGNQRGIVGAGTTTVVTSLDAVLELGQMATNGLLWLYVVVILIGVVILWRRRNYRLTLLWALGAPALSLLLNTVIAIYTPRYVLYMVIGLAVLVGAGLAVLPFRRVGLALLAGLMLISLFNLPTQWPNRTPYRDLLRRVSAEALPGDVILFDRIDVNGNRFIQWQVRGYLSRDLRLAMVETLDEADQHPRVWFVTDDWFNPDIQADFRQIESTRPLQQVIGDCTRDWCFLIQLLAAP